MGVGNMMDGNLQKRNASMRRRRKNIRLKGYDYSLAGAYFVTVCTNNRAHIFGEIHHGEMMVNDAGNMAERWFKELEHKFPDVQCDVFICMPDHIHFIIINTGNNIPIVGADPCVCPKETHVCPNENDLPVFPNDDKNMGEQNVMGEHKGSPLPKIVQWYKTMTTNEYIRHVKNDGWNMFVGKLWQRNYFDRVIRNNKELDNIRKYIYYNPAQ
ncbi:MAG TPA: transposase [Bacteroidota bacterium]|nr:transposase [Bacteroidota bacterium]